MRIPDFLKKLLLDRLLDLEDTLVFNQYEDQAVDWERIENLYIHIPFCRNKCLYCPYFKKTYQEQKAWFFGESLLREIELHAWWLKGKEMQSLYIGGGTPTLMTNLLIQAVEKLSALCILKNIALETTPAEINNRVLVELHHMGCNMISLGVQDFHQKYLSSIGRNYLVADTLKVIEKIGLLYYDTFNLDLIFAFPGQTIQELDKTLHMAMATPAHQLTFYPLFTFPYSTIGRFKQLKKVIMPDGLTRKRMYYHICDKLLGNGYKQVSVWSFLKGGKDIYSSVTRDTYLGLGPSAGTFTGKQFLFNTFHMNDYISLPLHNRIPTAYIMNITPNMERLFWIYWRLYETAIPLTAYKDRFGSEFCDDFNHWLWLADKLHYTVKKDNHIVLTKKGIHRVHLLQNHFSLDYINRIWTACTQDPPPSKVPLCTWCA